MNTNFLTQRREGAKILDREAHESAVLRRHPDWRRPPMHPADCICCGEPEQTGRYRGLPVCLPCYKTELLREWFDQQTGDESG